VKSKILLVLAVFFIGITAVTVRSVWFGQEKVEPVSMTLEELSQFDGKEGRPMYVAVNGEVFDLTKCRYWKDGIHTKTPQDAIAGRDLTDILAKSTHGIQRVKRYPLVGYIVNSDQPNQ